jgi:hypothetical protein
LKYGIVPELSRISESGFLKMSKISIVRMLRKLIRIKALKISDDLLSAELNVLLFRYKGKNA